MLAVIQSHPVQYHAPVYCELQAHWGVPATAIYGSDFSVAGYRDREFGADLAWDADLLDGYDSMFLSRVVEGGAGSDREVTTRGLAQALKNLSPRAILLTGYSPRFNVESFWLSRRVGCPLLFRGETTDHARARNRLKRWVRDRVLRWVYAQCARLLYVGQRSRQHFERLGVSPEKLIPSPYCVSTMPFQVTEADRTLLRDVCRRELSMGDRDQVLMFSGKLSHRKGVDLLVAAVKALPEEARKNLWLIFVGDGELRVELTATAAADPPVRVSFTGFQNQTQLSRFYHAADLLVLPSRHGETWGLVVNDALHHGLPCVVSDAVGCAPDLVIAGQTGEVFEAGSMGSLTAALLRALPLCHRLDIREAARERVSGYTVEKAAEGIARAYREVVGG